MQVVGGKNRPAQLLEPGVDFITETAPQQNAGERVIDTGFDFVPPVFTRLNGRKYVSENTVKELAHLIGWVPGDATREIQAEFDVYKAKVAELLASLADVAAVVQSVIVGADAEPQAHSVVPPADAEAQADAAKA